MAEYTFTATSAAPDSGWVVEVTQAPGAMGQGETLAAALASAAGALDAWLDAQLCVRCCEPILIGEGELTDRGDGPEHEDCP